MIDDDKINLLIIFGSLMLIISTFLPWIRYVDTIENYIIDLNAIDLVLGTFGMSFIPWNNWFDTYGILPYQIPLIFPLITGIIGLIFGLFRFFKKIGYFSEEKYNELIHWLYTFSFGTIIYITIFIYFISNFLWKYYIIIYLNGSGVVLCFIGSSLLFISGLIIKKQAK
ncbi:MAG: hypothetical protein ACTSRP_00395 [Candidatus Helarchaeota archaeon]